MSRGAGGGDGDVVGDDETATGAPYVFCEADLDVARATVEGLDGAVDVVCQWAVRDEEDQHWHQLPVHVQWVEKTVSGWLVTGTAAVTGEFLFEAVVPRSSGTVLMRLKPVG